MATPEEDRAFFDWLATQTPEQQAAFGAAYGPGGTATAAPAAAPDPGITAPAADIPSAGPSTTDRAVYQQLSAFLTSYGLGSLFTTDASGLPSGWLWDQIVSGTDTEAGLQLALEATPIYQERYGVITRMRQQAASGAPTVVPTIAQVRDYESNAAAMMKQAGFPPWFYDSYQDMQNLMEQNISLSELEQRVGQSWDLVHNTDPLVQQAFADFYGAAGDAALASFYLDPDKTISQLEKASRAAYAGGQGRSMGLSIDQQLAERIANQPLSAQGINDNLQQVANLQGRGVFTEGITETTDLTAEQQGIGAAVFGEGAAASQIERRIQARRANATTATGGAALTQAGQIGSTSS
jgi:hypothetical protein